MKKLLMMFAISLVMVACEKSETDGMLDAAPNASITTAQSVDIADIECKYWKRGIEVLERYDSDGNAIEIEPDMTFAGGTPTVYYFKKDGEFEWYAEALGAHPAVCGDGVYSLEGSTITIRMDFRNTESVYTMAIDGNMISFLGVDEFKDHSDYLYLTLRAITTDGYTRDRSKYIDIDDPEVFNKYLGPLGYEY